MTELLFRNDSYLREFEATIEEVNDNLLVLDKTAFSPRGGGLSSDVGKLILENGVELDVLEVFTKSGKVFHKISDTSSEIKKGTAVKGIIEWERRYKQMRLHTLLHIISSILYHKYGTTVTGGDIKPEKSRVDFDIDHLRQERLQEIESEVNSIIKGDHEVTVSYLEREEALKDPDLIRTKVNLIPETVKILRIVDIDSVDRQADGGVHVQSTREIGVFKPLKAENRGKNNKRLYFTVEP